MGDWASSPSCAHVQLQTICCKNRPFVAGQKNVYSSGLQREYHRKGRLVSRFKPSTACLGNANFSTALKGFRCMKKSSLRSNCMGMLINPEDSVNDWIPIVDQILLTVSVIFAYLAGVVPRDRTFSIAGNSITQCDAAKSSNGRSTVSISTDYWHETREKLADALSTIDDNVDVNSKAAENDIYRKKHPLNMFAIDKGPRLRLILVALHRLQKEVNAISENNEFVTRDIWLGVSSEVFKGAILQVCKEWLEVELNLKIGERNMKLTSKMFGKLKGDDIILRNINRMGKSELYSDLVFFLRFGSLSAGCCYDIKLLKQHGVDILEDLIVTLADTIASIYLELISIDSDISTELNTTCSTLCSMSTRTLQKLRNEVVLNQWLQENFESVTSIYEDRFDLHILHRELLINPVQGQNDNVDWWKKLSFRKSATKSSLPYVHIRQFSLSAKRTKELRALTGWRYYFSLYLELSDIGLPIVRAVFTKIRDAVSFLLVCMIGRSVGLIFTGIRQSLGWR